MPTLMSRYMSGQHVSVWDDIRSGAGDPFEIRLVADETMRRVRAHVERLASEYDRLGLQPASGVAAHHVPPADTESRLVAIERRSGALPAALAAMVKFVGTVNFSGDLPALGLRYDRGLAPNTMPPGPDWPDPLVLSGIDTLEYETEVWQTDEIRATDRPVFALAPDELHKANVSGGEHSILRGNTSPDPTIVGVAGRLGITLVQYLRVSIAWGGLPGYEFDPGAAPALLASLRAVPDF